jgi:branched-chain amino acid transport system permease protein
MEITFFLQTLINGIQIGFLYVLMALGLTLIFGIMHMINFAHGQLYMLGGFFLWWLFAIHHVNYVLAILLSVIIVAAIGFIVERFLLRPIRDQELYVMCMTIALGQFFEFAARTVWGPLDKAIPPVLPGIIKFADVAITYKRLMAVVVGIALVTGLYLFIQRTKTGLAMRAVEQDPEVATTYGMGINRTYALVFSLGALLAAASGALMGTIMVVNPVMGTAPMLKSFMIIILGGMGSIPGAIAGGLIVGLMDSFFSSLFGIDIAYIFVFVVAFTFIIFRPRGLFGRG